VYSSLYAAFSLPPDQTKEQSSNKPQNPLAATESHASVDIPTNTDQQNQHAPYAGISWEEYVSNQYYHHMKLFSEAQAHVAADQSIPSANNAQTSVGDSGDNRPPKKYGFTFFRFELRLQLTSFGCP
jgi:hypothetical protein